jgi:thioredoxin reductase (NADPH)
MAKPVLLTVDDDPDGLAAISGESSAGTNACSAPTRGPAALDVLNEVAEKEMPVALILSDQRMPGMDGVTFLTEAAEIFPDAKRVVLTAYADTDAAIAPINRSKVQYYLLKTWDPPEEKLYPVIEADRDADQLRRRAKRIQAPTQTPAKPCWSAASVRQEGLSDNVTELT